MRVSVVCSCVCIHAHVCQHLTQLVDDLSRQLYGDAYEPTPMTFTDQQMAHTQHQQLMDAIQQQNTTGTVAAPTSNNNGTAPLHPYTQFVPNHIAFQSVTGTSASSSATAPLAAGAVLQAAKAASGAGKDAQTNGTHAPTVTVK